MRGAKGVVAPPGRHLHSKLVGHRPRLLKLGPLAAFLAVLGPGILAGLSDDDPAGITTYSILGAKYGYEMLWVLTVSTLALIIFHDLGARMGVVTKKGLMTLIREHHGRRAIRVVLPALVLANVGTLCAEFAGVAASLELLAGVSRYVSVPLAAAGVSVLVLRGSFKRIEHVLLGLSAIFVAYVISGVLAHPDWSAAAEGLVVPRMPHTQEALLIAVATIGTTLAPWGLSFIQSYAANKHLRIKDLGFERIDVVAGAVMTGVIGFFVVVACAATLNVSGVTIEDARDASTALEPLAGHMAATLFGLGFLGASLLAAAIVPLSTAYSISESNGSPADLDDSFDEAPQFYLSYAIVVIVAALIVLIPGAPLVSILVLSQALNAILLLPILPFLRELGKDPAVMGDRVMGRGGRIASALALAVIFVSVAALGLLAAT